MELAPIVLFTYNRPWHTEQTLEALRLNKLADKSILHIYCDGPKEDATNEELKNIKKVRNLVKKKNWCKEVKIIEKSHNVGLAISVIEGVTNVVNKYGSVIVLEDDLITSSYFLKYCNEGLKLYKNELNVYSINGYQFPLGLNVNDSFLCPLATSSWGWATWKDRWSHFKKNVDYKQIIQEHPLIKTRFNFGDYDYSSMLNNSKSWAIKWYYSVFIRNGLGLFPTKSLVTNIGFDGSGENCMIENFTQNLTNEKPILRKKHTIDLELYVKMLNRFTISDQRSVGCKNRFKKFLKQLLKN
jgi:hypothetical protein